MIQQLEYVLYEKSQGELGLLSLEKRRLREDFKNMYKYLMGGNEEENRLW